MKATMEAATQETGAAPRWRLPLLPFVIACVCLVGVLIFLYPSGASWFSAVSQAREVSGYAQRVEVAGPAGRREALRRAHEYNEALGTAGGAFLQPGVRVPQAVKTRMAPFRYDDLLRADAHGLMATLQIPSIGLDLPVYHGTADSVLRKGIGHLQGTSLPVGGPGTHAVLTGHRGLPSSTLFTHLDRVRKGDRFTISVFGEVLTYRVTSTEVVDPDETQSLRVVPGRDLVTLVTCTPIGVNSQRILVTGSRVATTDADARTAHAAPVPFPFPWWAVWLAPALAVLALYVWWSGRPRRA